MWLSLQLSNGKGLVLGGVFSIYSIGELFFGFISGPIVDRYNRKKILILADLMRASTVATLYIIVHLGAVSLLHLYICTFLFSAFSPFFHRAEFTILPELVSKRFLMKANGILGGSKRLMRVLSPAFAGFIIHVFSIDTCFLFDALSFVLSSICISFVLIKPRGNNKGLPCMRYLLSDLRAGYLLVANSPLFMTLAVYAACINFVGGPVFPLLPIISERTCNSAHGYGIMMSGLSTGLIVSSFLIAVIRKPLKRIPIMLSGLAVCAVAIMIIAFANSILTIIIACFVMGMGLTMANLPIQTLFQERMPADRIGVASSFVFTIAQLAMPISMVLGGLMTEFYNIQTILVVLGSTMIVGALVGFRLPQFKEHSKAITSTATPE
jgi:MFS family permease